MDHEEKLSFGVFKPVGRVVISFPSADAAKATARDLDRIGLHGDMIDYYTDREMLAQIDRDLERASPLAGIGQDLNLIKAHQALAEQGYHWLVVTAKNDEQARKIADCAKARGAERAQHYGHFVIEELISHPTDMPQVADSPDRGLDPQTPSGKESERAEIRPPEDAPKPGGT